MQNGFAMENTISDFSPQEWLAGLKNDFLFMKTMKNLEQQYQAVPIKDEILRNQLQERAHLRLKEGPTCIPLLWEDLHDIDAVMTEGWEELCKVSAPCRKYTVISLFMLQRIEEWFESKKDKRPTALPTMPIPHHCKDAAQRIIVPRLFRGTTTLDSKQQIRKAMQLIDCHSGSQLAMLMVICNEAGAIRQGVNYQEFVQAMIGLGELPYENEEAIRALANSMSKKFNGYTRNGVKSPKFSWHHEEWTKGDKVLGERLYTLFI